MTHNAMTLLDLQDAVKKFAFPLNVYAWCLLKETGRIRHLHYGFFKYPDESVEAAQLRSTEEMFRLLPKPCRALEVGVGLGTTMKQLLSAGFIATGLTPELEQARVARTHCLNEDAIVVSRFETFDQDPGQWDLVIFQESAQYIDPLDLFGKCRRLLKSGGHIVLADEFALEPAQSGRDKLHRLSHFIDLGERFGFDLLEAIDVSKEAAQTVDHLIRMLKKYEQTLITDLGVRPDQLHELLAANRHYQQNYKAQRFGYRLIKFGLTRNAASLPGWVRAEHAPEVQALFSNVFKQSMAPGLWEWKYAQHRGQAIGVWDHDKLIAHYGGLTRPVMYRGKETLASQSADVMTSLDARRSLSRRSPLFVSSASYLEQAVGFGRQHLLGYGFPNERARRAAELLGLYSHPVGKIFELQWRLDEKSLRRFLYRCWLLNPENPGDAYAIDHCWHQMRQDTSDFIVGVRDAAWISHRYSQHPAHDYQIYAIAFAGFALPFGIVVLRKHPDGRFEWMDVVSKPSRIHELIYGLQRIPGPSTSKLFAWVSDAILALFPSTQEVNDLNIGIPTCSWTQGPSVDELKGRWWLMGGDSDFR